MKKHLLITAALSVFSALAIAGCAGQQTAPAAASAAVNETAQETPAAAAGTETSNAADTNAETAAGADANADTAAAAQDQNGSSGNAGQEAFAAETSSALKEERDVSGNITMSAELGEDGTMSVSYDALDLEPEYDTSAALDIRFDGDRITAEPTDIPIVSIEGSVVKLQAGGIYRLSGKLDGGQVLLEGGKKDRTLLVLDGVNITGTDSPAIYAPDGCRVLIRLEDGSFNVVRDGGKYTYTNDDGDEPDAVVFSKGDLSFNGAGRLKIIGNYGSGIHSKGVLTFLSGGYQINADKNAVKGKDAVLIRGGDFHLYTGNDAIKSTNKKDENAGNIWIENGTLDVNSGDKGITAYNRLVIAGGSVRVNAVAEALEGKTVDVLGGRLDLKAGDDGINASKDYDTYAEKKNYQEGVYIRFAGGETTVDAVADGIDSNGNLYLDGGALYVTGPSDDLNAILDYSGSAALSGGCVLGAGSSGMLQDLGAEPEQNYLIVHFDSVKAGGTKLCLLDAAGAELLSFTPARDYAAAILTVPELKAGETCTVTAGDESIELQVLEGQTVR